MVGAGPGDLGLVTLRAKECIEHAEIIVYDYLSNPEMLKWAPESAEIIYAGKKAGAHTLTQDEINALLVEKAREGKQVVRLKGGDPFMFGRGGEEAQARGRSCAVRHRSGNHIGDCRAGLRRNSGHAPRKEFARYFFTGHEDPEKPETSIDFAALAKLGGTQVMLMGVERIEAIAREMLANGVRSNLPVALIRWATTGRQETLVGDLENIAQRVAETGFTAPAIAVFGDVVALRNELSWFENRPLSGKRIVVTRTRSQAGV